MMDIVGEGAGGARHGAARAAETAHVEDMLMRVGMDPTVLLSATSSRAGNVADRHRAGAGGQAEFLVCDESVAALTMCRSRPRC
ncbi:hypothetical protein ACU4GD_01130 [Cupriavidus basilensis]